MYPSQVARASTVIDFNDGTVGDPIGNFYSSFGITFSNTSWGATALSFQVGGSTGLLLEDVFDNSFHPPFTPNRANPIIGIFDTAQAYVSILGVDIGAAGAELDAYDAAVGGNLIASATSSGTGAGIGNFDTLTVSAPGILRFDLFQPHPTLGDGMVFDNLTFGTDPDAGIEPATWILTTSGLVTVIALTVLKRRRVST